MGRACRYGKQKLLWNGHRIGPSRCSRDRDPFPSYTCEKVGCGQHERDHKPAPDEGMLMSTILGRAALGLIAGAVSVAAAHQTIVFILGKYGMTRSVPWNLQPLGYGLVPQIPVL